MAACLGTPIKIVANLKEATKIFKKLQGLQYKQTFILTYNTVKLEHPKKKVENCQELFIILSVITSKNWKFSVMGFKEGSRRRTEK